MCCAGNAKITTAIGELLRETRGRRNAVRGHSGQSMAADNYDGVEDKKKYVATMVDCIGRNIS